MHFPLMWPLHGLRNLFPDGLRPLRYFPFEEYSPSLCVCGSGAGEDERVDFPRLFSSWRKLHASPLVHLRLCFPLIALSLLSINADGVPFALRPCSFVDSFNPDVKISGSDLLIYTSMVFNFWQLGFELRCSISCSYNANTVVS